MKKLLWVGDAVASTGFARATHEICNVLRQHYDVHVLGINYHGDPHPYPYPIYPAYVMGADMIGQYRMRGMVHALKPDVIVLQNDPWNIQGYLKDAKGSKVGDTPVVGFIAVDGKNCAGSELNGLDLAIFWTRFAEREAIKGGYGGRTAVVPLGVDRSVYFPQDRAAVRERMLMAKMFADRNAPADSFVIGTVGRNHWRKRLDLTIQYFAEWIQSRDIRDAFLWIHSAPTADDAWDLDNLIAYYEVSDRVLLPRIPKNLSGLAEEQMARCYNMFDLMFTSTLGEGFWLPGFEAAACGTPIIAPDWSAVGELFNDAACLVPCTATLSHPNQTNTIGGVMDKTAAIELLHQAYADRRWLKSLGRAGYARVCEPRFEWLNIGQRFADELATVVPQELDEAAWADLGRKEAACL